MVMDKREDRTGEGKEWIDKLGSRTRVVECLTFNGKVLVRIQVFPIKNNFIDLVS